MESQSSADNSHQLDWRNHDVFHTASTLQQRGAQDAATVQPDLWPIPPRSDMQERWSFRQSIREETLQHRRIHRHGGLGATGRNIALVLRDRELKGASTVTMRRRPIDCSQYAEAVKQTMKGNKPKEGANPNSSGPDSRAAKRSQKNGAKISNPTSKRKGSKQKQRQPKQRICYPTKIAHEIRLFAEYCSVIRYHSAFFKHLGGDDVPGERGERPPSSKAVSTISIAFSPDSHTMASTHGDHTVKITCCSSGHLLQTLEGHPRTPWTVKYHPTDPALLASGCLGHQVRLWHWPDKVCLRMIRLEFAIISLSFHPGGNLLAVANGTRLHFWGYNQNLPSDTVGEGGGNSNNGTNNNAAVRNARGILTEVDQRHMLRCVHFPPEGNTIIIGGVNPTTDDPRRRNRGGIGGGGMSFYLRLWNFDVDAALQTFDDSSTSDSRRAISNVSTIAFDGSAQRVKSLTNSFHANLSLFACAAENFCSASPSLQRRWI